MVDRSTRVVANVVVSVAVAKSVEISVAVADTVCRIVEAGRFDS